MRIIAGTLGGRALHPPRKLPVRPTTDRTREALFNILEHRFDLEGARVLDLFSGTGAVSLECLSRGAASVVAVDAHRGCGKFLRDTARAWGVADRLRVRTGDAFVYARRTDETFDLIFLDPPYDLPRQEGIVTTLLARERLAAAGLLVWEHRSKRPTLPHPLHLFDRTYGESTLSFFGGEEE